MVNKSFFIGTLGRDPEQFGNSENGGCKFSIAVKTFDKTEWVNITVFGKLSQVALKYLKKGSRGFFDCRFQTNNYEKEGKKVYSYSFVCNNIVFLDSKEKKQSEITDHTNQEFGEIDF